MIVLVINCGSSSLKYQVLDMRSDNDYNLMAKGLVERIGLETGEITHRPSGKDKLVISKPVPDHTEGIKSVLELLTRLSVIESPTAESFSRSPAWWMTR